MLACRLNLRVPFNVLEIGNELHISWLRKAEDMEFGKRPFTRASVDTGYEGLVKSRDNFVDEPHNTVYVKFECLFCSNTIQTEHDYGNLGSEAILRAFYDEHCKNRHTYDISCDKCKREYRIDNDNNIFVFPDSED